MVAAQWAVPAFAIVAGHPVEHEGSVRAGAHADYLTHSCLHSQRVLLAQGRMSGRVNTIGATRAASAGRFAVNC